MKAAKKLKPPIRIFVFTAPGCGHCKPHKRVLDAFGKVHPEVPIIYIDVTTAAPEQVRFAIDHGVNAVPATFFINPQGRVLASAREACKLELIEALYQRALKPKASLKDPKPKGSKPKAKK